MCKERVHLVKKDYGVLVIAHGTKNNQAKILIENTVQAVQTPFPKTIAYLEFDKEQTISSGISLLENIGVNKIIIIPLFVSSGSTHLNEIKYMLGLDHSTNHPDIQQISINTPILWCSPMDDDPILFKLIFEQINMLSSNSSEENLLLIAHGSEQAYNNHIWKQLLEKLKQKIEHHYSFSAISYATLHPDNVTFVAKRLLRNGKKLIAIPLVISQGYLTEKKIPSKLDGLDVMWNGQTLIPHPLMTSWLEAKISERIVQEEER